MDHASEDPADAYAAAVVTPFNGGTLQVQSRPAQGAAAVDLAVTLPLYARVRRFDNQFATDTSSGGL